MGSNPTRRTIRPNSLANCRASPPDPTASGDERGLGPDYAYLLGIYLGDGWLTQTHRGVWWLRISMDAKYREIISVQKHPEELGKGLIHSDGCRATNRIRFRGRTYEYTGYFFTNTQMTLAPSLSRRAT